MTGQAVQAKAIKATIQSMFNALQLEVSKSAHLQSQVLENQNEAKRMQEKLQTLQEKMVAMQQQTLDRLAVIQNLTAIGYDLQRTTEFFDKYGVYILTMMQMVKYGIIAAGTVVPAMAQMKLVDRIDGLRSAVDIAKLTLGTLMDKTISYVQNRVTGNTIDRTDADGDDSFTQEALEGADLRQLESIVTADGHVKWVCLDHYRDSYKESATTHLRDLVAVNRGVFDEQRGSIEITLESSSVAKEFYEALIRARGVQELSVKLAWDATKTELQRFHHAIIKSNILILRLDGSSFNSPPRDFVNRGSRFDPILWLATSSKLQSFGLSRCDRFLERLSHFGVRATSQLRTLRWDDRMFAMPTAHLEIVTKIYRQCLNLKELIFDCTDMDKAYSIAKTHLSFLPSLSILRLVRNSQIDEITIEIKDGEALSMEVILEETLNTRLLFSGTVKSLTLGNYFFSDYDPEHFYSGNFLAANSGLERLTLESSLYIYNRPYKELAASLVLLANASNCHRHVATDLSKKTILNIGIPHFELHVLYWNYPELNLARIQDGKAILLDQIFGMHPRSAKQLTLGISELTKRGVESAIRMMNQLQPEVIEIFNYKIVDEAMRRLFVSGLNPSCCSKVTKLQLMYQELDEWIQALSQVMTRVSLPLLQSLAITDIPGSAHLSTQSACWISSMTARPVDVNCLPLTWLSIIGLGFSEEDWDLVLSKTDLMSLEYLSLEDCNDISTEQLFRLAERFPDKAMIIEVILPGRKWIPSMDSVDQSRIHRVLEAKTGHGVRVV
ncbi:hypothetical protein BGZ65_006044 [Modicella reniformis]|uniref:Uncharacterized protein n=1 Tax=Modicella reniformis TaxID=1440133 RepID=A0A9P6M7Z1_9FUNG|nr:hypothetical protein BGZ65_006044 [Modicella reniformis]